ncbi:MAG TPA: hypothetical protein VM933_06475 [Acidimicrobiales bacterium]|nr:hypothetical protein [Acidimicrobiales bacterium]
MTGWRVLAGMSVLLGGVFAGAPSAGAQEASSEVDVTITEVSEDDGKAIVTVRSHCTNDVVVQYQTGRSAPNLSRNRKSSFDARGPQASEGPDYQAVTGSFTVSVSRPFTFEVVVTDDDVAESLEHVLILFTHRQPTSGGTGVGGTKYFCDPVEATSEHTVESAFTVVDDDSGGAPSAAAPATGTGPSGATPPNGTVGPVAAAGAAPIDGRPMSPGAPPAAKPANVTPTTPAPGGATSAASRDLEGDEELPEAEGIDLVGAAVPSERRGSAGDPASAKARAIIATTAAAAAAGVLVFARRRRSRW